MNLYVNQNHVSADDSVLRVDNTESTPWVTISHALTQAVAGDTVIIQGGPYIDQVNLRPTNSGTESDPIVIRGETQGVTIEGLDDDDRSHKIFELDGYPLSWITIENLTFKGGVAYQFYIGENGSATNVLIQTELPVLNIAGAGFEPAAFGL